MKVRVLKEFNYSEDGIRSKVLVVGSEVDLTDAMIAGLSSEGLVSAVDGTIKAVATVAPVEPTKEELKAAVVELEDITSSNEEEDAAAVSAARRLVDIQDDWESMKFFALKSLAQKLTDKEVKDAALARSVVMAELEARKPVEKKETE